MPIAILVTGRSGTSMIARLLNLCGLYLGEEEGLWDERSNPRMNPTGYWEQRDIHELMDRLFTHLGGDWENPPLLTSGWEEDAGLEPFYREARGIVARVFGGHENWAWKLPKASVTIAFWRRVIPGLRFVVCVRNPLDFAQSLGQYTRNSRPHLLAMWQYYNYQILCETRPDERLVTFYEDYFPCYRDALAPLLDFAGLPPLVPESHADQQSRAFCQPDLKHYTSTLQDVLGDETVPFVTLRLYEELLAATATDPSARDLPLLREREMLLPLLQLALVGAGTLDGTGAVRKAEYERLQSERERLEKAPRRSERKRLWWKVGKFRV